MASASHKKIREILKEADLPEAQSEDLQKELESYFHEKELDLQFAGLKADEIQAKIIEDFGDEKIIGLSLQLVHKRPLYSLIKKYMKKFAVPFGVILFLVVFFAPWLWIDNGEDVLESRFFRLNGDQAFKNPRERIPISESVNEDSLTDAEKMCLCDGSCMRVEWVPFGAKVIGCAEDYYYISFWGQRFHINVE